MTTNTEQALREALRRIKSEAVSLADAQVLALEALALPITPPAAAPAPTCKESLKVAPAPAVPQGWKSVLIPTEWTIGPNLFKDWCSQWFGPDSDDEYLMHAAHALLGLAAAPAPAVPEIDYQALIRAACATNNKWAQGTNGCIAFARGVEWFRAQMLAATPAAPSRPAVPQGEPAVPQGWRFEKDYGSITVFTPSGGSCVLWERGHGGVETLAYQMACVLAATPSQEPAVPQGEPVAWRVSSKDEPELGFWLDEEGPSYGDMGLHYEPLYTTPAAPSQPVTLTDFDAIPDEVIDTAQDKSGMYRVELMRAWDAIIAALREKGELR